MAEHHSGVIGDAEVLGMSDRIIVMHEGHLSGEFTREQATQEVLMAAAVGKLNRVNQE